MRYYDLKRHWTKKIVPHLGDEELNHILVRDFNRYTFGRWHEPFKPGMLPESFESCDWRFDQHGPQPRLLAIRQARRLPLDRELRAAIGNSRGASPAMADHHQRFSFDRVGRCRDAVRFQLSGLRHRPGRVLPCRERAALAAGQVPSDLLRGALLDREVAWSTALLMTIPAGRGGWFLRPLFDTDSSPG